MPAFGQSQLGIPAPANHPTALMQSASDTVALTSELKTQNALLKDYHQHLLATVYYSLGGLVTIAILLVGFGWYSNFRIYDRDKQALSDELHKKLQEYEQALLSAYETRAAELVRQQEALFAPREKRLNERINQALQEPLQRIAWLEYSLAEMKLKEWKRKGVAENEIRESLEMLKAASELDDSFFIGRCLDYINDALNRARRLEGSYIQYILESLKRLPETFKPQADALQRRLLSSEIRN
jgi:hypothetical protein